MMETVACGRFCDLRIAFAVNDMVVDVTPIAVTGHEIDRRPLPADGQKNFVHAIWSATPSLDIIIHIEQASQIPAKLITEEYRTRAPNGAVRMVALDREMGCITGHTTRLIRRIHRRSPQQSPRFRRVRSETFSVVEVVDGS
jgi:hypothetical protein